MALEVARRTGSSRTEYDPDAPLVYTDRRTVSGAEPPIELWLEPGGIAFRLDSKRTLEIICRSAERGRIDVESHPEGHVTLFAWEHAVFTVLERGQEIFVQERAFSLEMVDGDTPRERVELAFGDFDRRRGVPPSGWR